MGIVFRNSLGVRLRISRGFVLCTRRYNSFLKPRERRGRCHSPTEPAPRREIGPGYARGLNTAFGQDDTNPYPVLTTHDDTQGEQA
jgi:hypothetical protein